MNFRKEDILDGVLITDIAKRFKIRLDPISSGNFTLRCRCPSKEHKNGGERTSSLYIDSNKNNFYCFGCSASSNVIDFHMLCSGEDFLSTINSLGPLIDKDRVKNREAFIKKSNFSVLVDISKYFKELQARRSNDLEWIEEVMKKTDQHIEQIDRYDVRRTKVLFDKIKTMCGRRYNL
jgi:hypothetical protein